MTRRNTQLAFRGKRVLVMGLGLHGGGLAAVQFFLKRGARVTITDTRSSRLLAPTLRKLELFVKKGGFASPRLRLGGHAKSDFRETDVVLKNPGVRPDSPFLILAKKSGAHVISDVTLFFDECPAPIIGVTGTRGKSTTVSLIASFLKKGMPRRRIWLGGNIRTSVLEFLERVDKDDLVVLELSSFQLMDLERARKSPAIAVLTNILNDHLNWHKSRTEYIRAKTVLFRFQGESDHVFIPQSDAFLRGLTKQATSHVHRVALPKQYVRGVENHIGAHYASSVGLAVAVAKHFKVSEGAIRGVLSTFRGLPSRQEEVRIFKGIHFINDTTATIPDAAIAALTRFYSVSRTRGGGVVLILGGSDKKLDFGPLMEIARRFAKAMIFLPGSATVEMKRILSRTHKRVPNIYDAHSMREAVRRSRKIATQGDTVLLSPGAASFGLFLNEFDRGDQFTTIVKRLS